VLCKVEPTVPSAAPMAVKANVEEELFNDLFGKEGSGESDDGVTKHELSAAAQGSATPGVRVKEQEGAGEQTPDPLQRQQAEETANAAASSHSTDPDGWEDEVPIIGLSIDDRLPAGAVFNGLGRIRATINMYTKHLAELGWAAKFKPETVQALQRRLVAHEANVKGKFHVDIQVAFVQLKKRVCAVVNAHKTIRSWLDTQDDTVLADAVVHLDVVVGFLTHQGTRLSPDMAVLHMHARFFRSFAKESSVLAAMGVIDFTALSNEFQRMKLLVTAPAEEPEDSVEGEAANASKKKVNRKRRKRFTHNEMNSRIDFACGYDEHVAKLVAVGVRKFLFPLTEESVNDDNKVKAICDELSGALVIFKAKTDSTSAVAADWSRTLGSVIKIFACMSSDPKLNPTIAEVRAARRTLIDDLKRTEGPSGDVSKIMVSYHVPKRAMEVSRIFSATGVQDDAASQAFESELDKMESEFSDAFENVDQWMLEGAGGSCHTAASFSEPCNTIQGTAEVLLRSLQGWSLAALQDKLEAIDDALQNLMILAKVGCSILVKDFPVPSHSGGGNRSVLETSQIVNYICCNAFVRRSFSGKGYAVLGCQGLACCHGMVLLASRDGRSCL